MRKTVVCAMLCLVLAAFAARAASPVEDPKACQQCGMDRVRFAHSRMIVEYADGSVTGICSIHCAAADIKKHAGKAVKSLKVADYGTKELTDAKNATWVVGGKQKGVMTGVPKWAFAKSSDAQAFVKESGGKVTPFRDVMKAAEAEVSH